MKTPLLDYVPLEEDEEKGNSTIATSTTPQEEEDESDPEFISYMQKSRETYWENRRNRQANAAMRGVLIILFVFLAARDLYEHLYLKNPACSDERSRSLFSGQSYTIYAAGTKDAIYNPISISVPSEEHCTFLKQCTKGFATVECYVKPHWTGSRFYTDPPEPILDHTDTLPPVNQNNAGL